jgi:hypothetical protein
MKKERIKQLSILIIIFIILLSGGLLIFKYLTRLPIPKDALSVREVLTEQKFNQSVKVYGKVSNLGTLGKPAFELKSENATTHVWYALMAEDDGTPMPEVSIEHIKNDNWVIVEGELKDEGKFHDGNIIWATSIIKAETKHNRDFFTSMEECQEECINMGYEIGKCYLEKEVQKSYTQIDDCLILNSEKCHQAGDCKCYCYNKS